LKAIFHKLCILVISALVLGVSGCKSYWIDADIENQTGQPIHELEVDYPSASFGANALAPGAAMHYRFQTRGSGPVKVEYSFGDGKTTHAQGLTLAEHQQGHLTIRLLPLGKVEFVPALQPAS
jgi:hypothetical protein